MDEIRLFLKPPSDERELLKYVLSSDFKPSNYNISFEEALTDEKICQELRNLYNNYNYNTITSLKNPLPIREADQKKSDKSPPNIVDRVRTSIGVYESPDGVYSFRKHYGMPAKFYEKFNIHVFGGDLTVDFLPILTADEPFRIIVRDGNYFSADSDILKKYSVCLPEPGHCLIIMA